YMADAKKDAKPAPSTSAEAEILFVLFILVGVGFVALPILLSYFHIDIGLGDTWNNFVIGAEHLFFQFLTTTIFISLFISLIFGLAIFYAKFRTAEILDRLKASQAQKKSPVMPIPSPS